MEKNKLIHVLEFLKVSGIFILILGIIYIIPNLIASLFIEIFNINNQSLILALSYLIIIPLIYLFSRLILKDKLLAISNGTFTFFIFLMLSALIGTIIREFMSVETKTQEYIFLSICYFIILVTFFLIFKNYLKNDWINFKKDRKELFKIAFKYWVYGLFIMIISNYIINIYINKGSIATNEELNRAALGNTPIITVLAMVIFAPFTEELAFRAGFKKAFNNAVTFALFTGLLFAGAHIVSAYDPEVYSSIFSFLKNWRELLYIIPYGSLGFFFGMAYYKTDNIFSTMSVHAMHNAISVLLILLAQLAESMI